MAVTSWKTPGTVTSAGDGSYTWSNPSYADSDDNNYASVVMSTAGQASDHLLATNFGFSTSDVPEGSTIDGVEARTRRYASQSNRVQDSSVKLAIGGSLGGDSKASSTFWGTSEEDSPTYGASDDTWNNSIDDSDVRSSGFGVGIAAVKILAQNRTAYIDVVELRVYYTEGGATTHYGAAALSGSGSAAGAGWVQRYGAAAFGGVGSLAGAGWVQRYGAAAFGGDGSLAVAGVRETFGAAPIGGSGSMAAAGFIEIYAAAALVGAGSLVAAGERYVAGAAALSGAGAVAGAGWVQRYGVAALSGVGSVAAAGWVQRYGSAALAGSGAVVVVGLREVLGVADLAGSGAVVVVGLREVLGAAALLGEGLVVATPLAGGATVFGAAALAGAGTLVARPFSWADAILVIAAAARGVSVSGDRVVSPAGRSAASPGSGGRVFVVDEEVRS